MIWIKDKDRALSERLMMRNLSSGLKLCQVPIGYILPYSALSWLQVFITCILCLILLTYGPTILVTSYLIYLLN